MTEETQNQLALREKRRQEMEEATFATNQQGGALMNPQNGKELMDFANLMAGSGAMVRDFYRNNPGDCAALIMICQPYGFNPFMVSWKTYKASKNADAPISFEGQLVNAMVNVSAPVRGRLRYHYEGEGGDLTCTVMGVDRETGDEITYTSPKLSEIPIKNSPLWKGDPRQQLGYYSARAWARRHFPELLLGIYTRDEIDESGMRDVTPKTGFQRLADKARAEAASGPQGDDATPDPQNEAKGSPEPAQDATDAKQAGPSDNATTHDTSEGPEIDTNSPAYGMGVDAARDGMFDRDSSPFKNNPEAEAEHAAWVAGFDSVKKESGDDTGDA